MTEPEAPQRIALVAHDQKKDQMVECVSAHAQTLRAMELFGARTTESRIEKETGLWITKLKSSPLGGDAQIGHALQYRIGNQRSDRSEGDCLTGVLSSVLIC